jgi:hypothetical protein
VSSGVTGESWECPHCGERILRSAAICPACSRRLRAEAVTAAQPTGRTVRPLTIDGTIRHPGCHDPCEYSVLIEVQDEEGELLARRSVGVGVLRPGETRRVILRVEVIVPDQQAPKTTF